MTIRTTDLFLPRDTINIVLMYIHKMSLNVHINEPRTLTVIGVILSYMCSCYVGITQKNIHKYRYISMRLEFVVPWQCLIL